MPEVTPAGTSRFELEVPSPTGRLAAALSDLAESLVLYTWDGTSDLVQDIDYVTWGVNTAVRFDKTGITIGSSTFAPDTPVAVIMRNDLAQIEVMRAAAHAFAMGVEDQRGDIGQAVLDDDAVNTKRDGLVQEVNRQIFDHA